MKFEHSKLPYKRSNTFLYPKNLWDKILKWFVFQLLEFP